MGPILGVRSPVALSGETAATLIVAAAVLGLSLPEAASAPIAIAIASVLVWVVLLAGLASGALPHVPLPRAAVVAGLALLGVAALTALSLSWTDDRGRAFADLVRVSGYVGLFALVVASASARRVRPLLAGIGIGLAAVAAYAVTTRFLPGLFGGIEDPVQFLASPAPGRLSDPIGYWNGLAAVAATAIVLLGWLAGQSATRYGRALAAAALPVVILALYLTDSRGGVIAAFIAIFVMLVATPGRVRLLVPLGIGVGGGLALAALASARPAFSAGAPTSAGDLQGLEMLGATLAVMLIVGAINYAVDQTIRDGSAIHPWRPLGRFLPTRVPMRTWWVAAVAVLVAVLLAGPPLLEDFKEAPAQDPRTGSASLASGSGRYQLWDTALDAFASAPLRGIGASSFGGWWNQNGSLSLPARDAHSIFVESLSELGIGGLALMAAFFGVAAVAGWRRTKALKSDVRGASEATAALAVLVVGLLVASVDWTWELPAVFVPTVVAAALLTGAATHPPWRRVQLALRGRQGAAPDRGPSAAVRRRLSWLLAILGAAAICAGGVLLVAELELGASRAALERGDTVAAARHARDAATIEPWAAAPRSQLAAVEEFAGNPRTARRWLEDAVERSPFDPELWRQLSEVSAQLGERERALAEATRGASLSPTLRR